MLRRSLWMFALCALAPLASAQFDPPPPPDRLPPPVEQVLSQLSLDDTKRELVRQTLLRQHQERVAAEQALRERHRSELSALLTVDQLVALDAVRPPPHRGPAPQDPRPLRR